MDVEVGLLEVFQVFFNPKTINIFSIQTEQLLLQLERAPTQLDQQLGQLMCLIPLVPKHLIAQIVPLYLPMKPTLLHRNPQTPNIKHIRPQLLA